MLAAARSPRAGSVSARRRSRVAAGPGLNRFTRKRVGSFRWVGFATAVLIESTGGIGEVQEGSVSPNTDTRSATCSGVR